MFFGHLHASNVIVDEGVCRLVDVENGILGVPSFLRPAFTQHRKINVRRCLFPEPRQWELSLSLGYLHLSPQSMEGVDIFCFGHLLYEMTYGQPPDSVPINHYPAVPYAAVGQCIPIQDLGIYARKMASPSLILSNITCRCVFVCVCSVSAAVHFVPRSL